MAATKPAHEPITGGCLCAQVRYTISFPTTDTWPPPSHCCQCTMCRKVQGSLVAPFLNVPTSNISWSRPRSDSRPVQSESASPLPPFQHYQSSEDARRGFCRECGSSLTFWAKSAPEVTEICTGTLDEKWLIGDRTERVSSEELAKRGRWEEVVKEEGDLGKELAAPQAGYFFFRNAVAGVTDQKEHGARWVEDSQRGLQILD